MGGPPVDLPTSKESQTKRTLSHEVDDDDDNDADTRPSRWKPTMAEKVILSESYEQQPYPSPEEKLKLANQLGVKKKQISKWFQHKRESMAKAGQLPEAVKQKDRRTHEELEILLQAFEENPYPTTSDVDELVKKIGTMTVPQTKLWFKHRRSTLNKKGQMELRGRMRKSNSRLITREELIALNAVFAVNPELDPRGRQLLANHLSIDPASIGAWFKRRSANDPSVDSLCVRDVGPEYKIGNQESPDARSAKRKRDETLDPPRRSSQPDRPSLSPERYLVGDRPKAEPRERPKSMPVVGGPGGFGFDLGKEFVPRDEGFLAHDANLLPSSLHGILAGHGTGITGHSGSSPVSSHAGPVPSREAPSVSALLQSSIPTPGFGPRSSSHGGPGDSVLRPSYQGVAMQQGLSPPESRHRRVQPILQQPKPQSQTGTPGTPSSMGIGTVAARHRALHGRHLDPSPMGHTYSLPEPLAGSDSMQPGVGTGMPLMEQRSWYAMEGLGTHASLYGWPPFDGSGSGSGAGSGP